MSDKIDSPGKVPGSVSSKLDQKQKPMTKAERRAIQEMQRAAKAAKKAGADKKTTENTVKSAQTDEKAKDSAPTPAGTKMKKSAGENSYYRPLGHLRLFSAMESLKIIESPTQKNIHSRFRQFGEKLVKDELASSNEKCRELLEAITTLMEDFKTPEIEDFSRAFLKIFESHIEFLNSCRPITVNMLNCTSYIKGLLAQMMHIDESEARQTLTSALRKYYEERMLTARQDILSFLTSKQYNLLSDGDTIMIVGCSSSALEIIKHLIKQGLKFKLIICHVNEIPENVLSLLEENNQDCLHVSLSDVPYMTNKISKIIVPAMVLFGNGNAVTNSGYAQTLEILHKRRVPSIICCETYKFVDDVTINTLDRNELFDLQHLFPQTPYRKHIFSTQLRYDLISPKHITYLVCEKGVLPATSSSAVSRLKFSDNPLIIV